MCSKDVTTITELMGAALHKVNAISVENEQLKSDVARLSELVQLQNNTIRLAHGLAQENVKLHNACKILVESHSKLKEVNITSQDKLRSLEEEFAVLKEEHGQYHILSSAQSANTLIYGDRAMG
jgi:hypothetical protein